MRLLAPLLVVLSIGCGSALQSPDGGGGDSGGGGTGGGGTGGTFCVLTGVRYPPGPVPSADGCNSCTCTAGGLIACTERACPVPTCALDATYVYGDTGGLVAYENEATLAPPASYLYMRRPVRTMPPNIECSPALPVCNATDLIDVADIMRDIADTDVQKALAMAAPPTYGGDTRPVDGSIFQFLREDGRGFLAGVPCGTAAGCVEVPAGIARFVADLRALDIQQLADPSCAALR